MTRVDLATFGVRGLFNAQERAVEYQKQLDEIVSPRLRRRFLEEILDRDPVAKRLMAK
jgi:hypothetical protein